MSHTLPPSRIHQFGLPPLERWSGAFLVAVLIPSLGLPAAEPASVSNADCLVCHSDADLTKTNAQGKTVSLFVDETAFQRSAHGTNQCVACHTDVANAHPDDGRTPASVDCAICHERPSESYRASVHAFARGNGEEAAATCTDCHGTHQIQPVRGVDSPLQPSQLVATCGACHPDESAEVEASVHGQASAAGLHDAPTCTDCHAEHRIEPLKQVSPIKLSEQICSRCHASERINTKYRLPTDRLQTFLDSYHGLSARFGSTRAANCASCHGAHRILPSSDPRSSIHPTRLVATCGRCHPGANENFALSKVHLNGADTDAGAQVNRWVRRIYQGLIAVTIGLFLFHNAALWLRHALVAKRSPARTTLRMDLPQRIQHLLLAVSFVVLAVTGFALTFPDSWIAWLLGADENIRRWMHRLAGLVLLGLGLYHVGYVLLTAAGRRLVKDFWPARSDWTDLIATARYTAGRQPRLPHGERRFGYVEKIEYWAVVWGTIIMALTGLAIWFPLVVTTLLPRWVVDVATTIHYYEAILACLAILVWHFYHVIFDPRVYPLNWAFWDGRSAAPPASPTAVAGPGQTG